MTAAILTRKMVAWLRPLCLVDIFELCNEAFDLEPPSNEDERRRSTREGPVEASRAAFGHMTYIYTYSFESL